MSADFCTSIDCPLNQVTLDERSDGLELIIGFVSSSHQSGYVFTPSQISTISNEISCIIYKYNKSRDAMIARYGPNAAIHCPDFAIYNPQQQLANKVQKPVIELENLNTNKITSPPPKSMNKTISAPNNLAPPFSKPNKLSEFVPKQQQQQFPSPSAPPLTFADLETLEKIRQAPVEAKKNPPKQSTALADVALMTRIMKGIAVEKRPDQTTIDERIAAMNEAEARELAPEPVVELVPKREPDSPHTRLHFRDIYEQTGFVGLKKKESLKKVSSVLNRPLGCCYDEVRKSWAIADSRNNRILLYPDGLSVESPKFINPASVCVIRPGQTLGILSDSCLCVYTYSNQQVAVVVEGADGRKIGCRGLATTPLGNIVTIHRIDHAMFEAVIYDMFDPKKYGDIVSRISFTAGNPSFCHMNGNRLVISDLGNQTLMMFEYNHQETTAKLKKTVPFKWDHQGEPNGGFDFVSGVQVDVEGWSLVADAGGRTIQLFDQDLKFVCRVGCDFALPYTSAIAINQKREVMIIPRQQPAEVIVATLESFDRLPPILGLPGHSKRFVNHTPNTSFARFPGSANTSYQSPTTTSAHNSGRVFQSREFDDLPFGAKQP